MWRVCGALVAALRPIRKGVAGRNNNSSRQERREEGRSLIRKGSESEVEIVGGLVGDQLLVERNDSREMFRLLVGGEDFLVLPGFENHEPQRVAAVFEDFVIDTPLFGTRFFGQFEQVVEQLSPVFGGRLNHDIDADHLFVGFVAARYGSAQYGCKKQDGERKLEKSFHGRLGF